MSDPWAAFRTMPAPTTHQDQGQDDPWAAFRQKPVSTGQDVVQSFTSGLMNQGLPSMVGGFGDLISAAKGFAPKAVGAMERNGFAPKGTGGILAQALKHNPVDESPGVKAVSNVKSAAVKALQGGGAKHAADIVDLAPTGTNLPTTAQVQKVAPFEHHDPQTKMGQRAETLGQFAPAALMPGTAGQRLAAVMGPAAGSQAAGELTEGTPLEPVARIAGAVTGGALAGALTRPMPAERMLAKASIGASDADIEAARVLRNDMARRGVNITQAEAIQQVTDNATGMGTQQRVLEGTSRGGELVRPYMRDRPAQVQGAIRDYADTIAPPTDQPSVIGMQSQDAAQRALRGVEEARTTAVNPAYQAAGPQAIPHDRIEAILSDMDAEIAADRTGIISSRLTPLRNRLVAQEATQPTLTSPGSPRVPLDDINSLNAIRMQERDALGLPQIGAEATTKFQASRVSHYLDRIRGLLDTNPDFQAGNQQFQRITNDVVDPLVAGPLGKISASDSLPTTLNSIYPQAPLEGASHETRRALTMMGEQNPTVPPNITRQHLMNTANEATQNLHGGPAQYGGAKWAAKVAANPEQRRNLMSGVEASGGDPDALASLLSGLEATGKRQAPGSQTAYNVEELKALGDSGAMGEVLKTGLNLPGSFRRIGDFLQGIQTNRNASALSQALLSDPDQGAAALLAARRSAPTDALEQTLRRLALTAILARQPQQ